LAGVFISYRREDAAGWTGRIYDRAIAQLGVEHVFMDIDDIPIGADFSEVITRTLEKVDAMVVVIGPNWLRAADHEGRRRLDDPADYVRREVMGALAKGALVVPVLVDNAPMPADRDLPEELKPLAYRNAVVISDIRFDYDVGRLVDALERVTAEAQAKAEEEARLEAEAAAQREAEEKARLEAEERAKREAEERAKAAQEAEAWEKAQRVAEEQARRVAEEQARRVAEEQARRVAEEQARRVAEEQAELEAEEKARREAEDTRSAPPAIEAPQPVAGTPRKRRRVFWIGAAAALLVAVAIIGVTTLGDGGWSGEITSIDGRPVLFQDDFDAQSSAWWDVGFPFENGAVRIDGSSGTTDPWVCWGRHRSLSGSAAVWLFSIEDTLSIDFGMASDASGQSWSLWLNGPGDDIAALQWVDGRVVNSEQIAGVGQVEIGRRYYALLQHDGSRFDFALWDADSEETKFVHGEQAGEDWAGREWTIGLCVHRATAVLHEYLELE
jgi:hypothetical protein